MELTENEKEELLGKNHIPPLYYKFGDYKYNTQSKERVLSGLEDLDYLVKGFEMGCITIWTGQSNAGKTTVLTMITKQTILQNEKVFYFNGEQTKDDFKNNLYKQTASKGKIYSKQYKNSNVFDEYVVEDEAIKLSRLYDDNLFIYNNEARRTVDFLISAMNDVMKKYKVRVFMLDNFMQIETTTNDEYREQKEIMEKLRTFAVNNNIHIHLVVHQKKIEKNSPRITIYDVFGSSNLVNKAYNVIAIERIDNLEPEDTEYKRLQKTLLKSKYDITQTDSVLEVLKTKGNACGIVGLVYDRTSKTYTQQEHITSELWEKMRNNNTEYKNKDVPF